MNAFELTIIISNAMSHLIFSLCSSFLIVAYILDLAGIIQPKEKITDKYYLITWIATLALLMFFVTSR